MKHKSELIPITFFSIVSLLFFASCNKTNNWPQFRGSQSNMITDSKNLPDTWSNNTNVIWTYNINGAGWSSPIIWNKKVFILSVFPEDVKERPQMPMGGPQPPEDSQGERPAPGQNAPQGGPGGEPRAGQGPQPGHGQPMGPQPEDTLYKHDVYRWEVTCIDLNTGKELWKQIAFKGHPRINKNPMSNYATETPVTDGKRVYAYFGMLGLYCYNMDGNLLWQKDLGSYNTQNGWGTGSSPVLYKDILYIQVDNEIKSFIVAINAATGTEKWRVERDEKTNYSSPIIWKNKIRTELVAGGKTARAYDLNTGKVFWELKLGGEMCIPSPLADEGHLYIGNEGQQKPGKFYAVKAGADGDITPKEGELTSSSVEWSSSDTGLGSPSPLLYKGFIYTVAARGGLITCTNASDGKQVYKERINGVGAVWSSPWACNDKIFFCDEKGLTQVIKAGEKFERLHSNKLDDKFWTSVAITDNVIIFRGVEKLYCVKK
jgi:outer membrane protein assembly factor BamB